MQRSWDIFCTVIDNYGDIGVCWRLAKQLVAEHHQSVRLWVDDLASFAQIAHDIHAQRQHQSIQGVEICLWQQSVIADVDPADIVIEAFGCELPTHYVQRLALKKYPVLWVNLEYLSAESWVPHYHELPSPHPDLPLIKTFFFPGFVAGTGGLLREHHLISQRNAFDAESEHTFLQHHHFPIKESAELWVSLFCYETAPIERLVQILCESSLPVVLFVPEGEIARRIRTFLTKNAHFHEKLLRHGQLTVQVFPWLEQAEYDRLLWSCDINIVRGEDSFVRAQWAAKPFIWTIYPQTDDAHWNKLNAFLDCYTAGMETETTNVVRALWTSWNGKTDLSPIMWMNFLALRKSLMQHNNDWVDHLLKQNDLTSNLVQFVENRL